MPKIERDGFEFYTGLNNYETFSLRDNYLESALNYIKNHKILSISLGLTNSIENLSFLKKIDFIEEIFISDLGLDDYSGIYYLENLKKLHVNLNKNLPHLEYSKFKNLEFLSIDWHLKFPDLSVNSKLKELEIWKFKPKSKSFKEIKLPESLESLEITESNILDLEGLSLPNLKVFEGYYCSTLKSLNGIQNFSSSLTNFALENSRKVSDYEYLQKCKNLTKLRLSSCGDIDNLRWLNKLKALRFFSFVGTKLIDGDTSPCIGIDYVAFNNQRHFNHKFEEFKTTNKKITYI